MHKFPLSHLTAEETLVANPRTVHNLIIVCCHATWTGDTQTPIPALEDPAGWLLQDFQRDEAGTFAQEAERGVAALAGDPTALLVFSGGHTRAESAVAEGESYHRLAKHTNYWNHAICASQVVAETASLDSFQNLLFSLLLFRHLVGSYPRAVTVVSHDFKRKRIRDLHWRALKMDPLSLRFVGVPVPEASVQAAWEGELSLGLGPFEKDMYGKGSALTDKRRMRDVMKIQEAAWEQQLLGGIKGADDDEIGVLKEFLSWKGGDDGAEIFPGRLPWETFAV